MRSTLKQLCAAALLLAGALSSAPAAAQAEAAPIDPARPRVIAAVAVIGGTMTSSSPVWGTDRIRSTAQDLARSHRAASAARSILFSGSCRESPIGSAAPRGSPHRPAALVPADVITGSRRGILPRRSRTSKGTDDAYDQALRNACARGYVGRACRRGVGRLDRGRAREGPPGRLREGVEEAMRRNEGTRTKQEHDKLHEREEKYKVTIQRHRERHPLRLELAPLPSPAPLSRGFFFARLLCGRPCGGHSKAQRR